MENTHPHSPKYPGVVGDTANLSPFYKGVIGMDPMNVIDSSVVPAAMANRPELSMLSAINFVSPVSVYEVTIPLR